MAAVEGEVALLIDFENLVRSVDEENIDCEAVVRLADEYGRVLVANAYADWRMKDVNQYQSDLYGLGIELVHVFGQRRGALLKNAVDVKMAVDAVSLISSLPHIDIYVIVSGDRDFIHVLKELRRHGKTVIGVSPNSAVSSDFSSLCDRFVRYEALTSTMEPTGVESMAEVRAKLAEIVRDNPDGLHGSEVKTMLRRALSSSFDESAYGFASFGSFLGDMGEVVRVVPAPAAGGDLRVYPVSTGGADSTDADAARLVRQVKLAKMGYEGDAPRRRRVLSRLFDVMTRANGTFTLSNVHGSMERTDEDAPSSFSDIVKYARILRMGGALVVEESPEDVFFRDRSMSLTADISTVESMILAYESTVTTRLVVVAGETPIDAPMVCAVLGLDHHASGDLAYCEEVLESARCRAVELAMRGT
ncbi:MAG: NYN domain-containing protein [Gammaproteobacteria bacterium]|nr:NYN domain-containing protein [Gammaproteobacteria bacterium]